MKKILSSEELSSLCLELYLLLHSGQNVGDTLAVLAEESDEDHRAMLEEMSRKVDEGECRTLHEALRQSGCFPSYVCGLIEAGEDNGKTEEALLELARYYESRTRLNRRVRSALLYPAVMLGLMLVVIAVLLVKVLPIFNDVYASLGGQLTGVAGGLLTLGRWLDAVMPVLWLLLAALAVVLAAFAGSDSFRGKLLGMWRSRQGDKGVARKMNTAQLAYAMSLYAAIGEPMETAIGQAARLMEDVPPAKARCLDCIGRMERGEKAIAAMRESDLLPAGSCRLLERASASGKLDETMAKVAADLSEDSEASLEELVGRVEPALVLTCSVLVGLILLSVMLPLMHIMSAIG